ncbi:MAG: G8 domain-containing protein [Armatimonadota bacterium]|nr:G8 domain-containing protein [Armatimonadota bacterium]
MLIPSGRTIELDIQTAEARSVTVEGTLRASRTTPSRLTLYGNLVVRQRGILDYGRPTDRVVVNASIRWFLDESRYVGGNTMEPLPTDVGLWAVDDAQVWVHGRYRDTWSPLLATAAAGSSEIRVDPTYAQGWEVGDLVVLTPTTPPAGGERGYPREDERRRIAAVLGPGSFRLDAPLRYAHTVIQVSWTDTRGDRWTETLAGKVANLTSNITFEAGDPNHRPHIMFLGRAKHYVEDLAVVTFSPTPRDIGVIGDSLRPFGRYAWHNHLQEDGSRGSYLRRTRLYDGVGNGLHLHQSWGIEVTDLVVYNQARFKTRGPNGVVAAVTPIMIEEGVRPTEEQGRACDDCYIDRPLVIAWGWDGTDEPYNNHGIMMWSSLNCAIVGAVATGGRGRGLSSGMHWAPGGAGWREQTHVYRAEAFANRARGFDSWQNSTSPTRERIVDLLAWNNDVGIAWGAYVTSYWGHHIRAIGNQVQFLEWASGWGVTDFLADGLNRTNAIGIEIGAHTARTPVEIVYEEGVVRSVAVGLRHEQSVDAGQRSIAQFVRLSWNAIRGILFDGSAVPPAGSWFRIRQQRGLPRATDFTLYRRDDPNAPAGAVLDTEYNALRVDNDPTGTRPAVPRVFLRSPADETIESGSVTLVVDTNATSVQFFEANRLLATVPVVGGRATLVYDMSRHPYRRAYFWAQASANGVVGTSRVLRIRKF